MYNSTNQSIVDLVYLERMAEECIKIGELQRRWHDNVCFSTFRSINQLDKVDRDRSWRQFRHDRPYSVRCRENV